MKNEKRTRLKLEHFLPSFPMVQMMLETVTVDIKLFIPIHFDVIIESATKSRTKE